MSKLRVYELARELNVETKVMMAKLKSFGHNITNHQSTLTDQQVSDLRKAFGGGGSAQSVATGQIGASSKPRVVVRRRAATGADTSDETSEAMQGGSSGGVQSEEAAPLEPVAKTAPLSPPIVSVDRESTTPQVAQQLVQAEKKVSEAADKSVTVVSRPSAVSTRRSSESSAVVISAAPRPVPKPVVTSSVKSQATLEKDTVSKPSTTAGGSSEHRSTEGETIVSSVLQTPGTSAESPEVTSRPIEAAASVASAMMTGRVTPPNHPQSQNVMSSPVPSPSTGMVPQKPAASVTRTASPSGQPIGARPSPGPVTPTALASTDEGKAVRRREVSGATIVRRATQEEREKLESKGRSAAGRKEDNRGTRVTGMGLLSNRVSTVEAPVAPAAPGFDSDDASARRGPPIAGAKDRKTVEEEEQAKKKAAAKARRSNTSLTTRALLEQAEDLFVSPEPVEEEAASFTPASPQSAVSRTVYTPIASRNKRDLKRRKDLKKTQITTPRAAYRVVEMGESITVGELARQLTVKAPEIIKKLMSQGLMATINQPIDLDTATLIAQDYSFEVKSTVQTVADILGKNEPVDESLLSARPPIVTVMGHVDHGKTSILDAIRSANVASGEAGGITQHIGAYTVDHDGSKITFLDTPGHEAFSAMRARGAGVTDIVVLVVAADDGVMPQTIEAISHAKAAGVPIIVAVNKIDKPNVNFDRIYTELNSQGVQAEEWGGDVQFVKCSALQRVGIGELLDAILLQAEILDLKARADGFAEGSVIEAHLDKGRGPVATIVVQAGTLNVGDFIVAGVHVGRVRAMSDYKGTTQANATPSIPVEIIGLSGVPMAGDHFNAVVDEKTAREVADHRLEVLRKAQSQKSSAQRLEDLLAKVKSDEIPEVVFIVKADTQGSAEAIQESILKLSTTKVKNRIVHCAVGGISESDVTLAAASGAIIIGFNVRAARGLDDLASKEGVVVQYFSIIYEIVDAVKSIMVGKLPPVISEVILGHAEVRKPISVPKIGTIGGSAVLDGKITRTALCRLIRNQIVIFTGKLGSLRRFKDDVKEVAQGYECGIGIDGYNDLREGDVIEAYMLEESAATL